MHSTIAQIVAIGYTNLRSIPTSIMHKYYPSVHNYTMTGTNRLPPLKELGISLTQLHATASVCP